MAERLAVTVESLREKITRELDASHAEVEDLSGGCGRSFSVKIISPLFEKKTALSRHRLVNTTLKDEISSIHAWSAKCFTPAEWTALNDVEEE